MTDGAMRDSIDSATDRGSETETETSATNPTGVDVVAETMRSLPAIVAEKFNQYQAQQAVDMVDRARNPFVLVSDEAVEFFNATLEMFAYGLLTGARLQAGEPFDNQERIHALADVALERMRVLGAVDGNTLPNIHATALAPVIRAMRADVNIWSGRAPMSDIADMLAQLRASLGLDTDEETDSDAETPKVSPDPSAN